MSITYIDNGCVVDRVSDKERTDWGVCECAFFWRVFSFLVFASLQFAFFLCVSAFWSACVTNVSVLHRAVVLYFGLLDSGAWFTGHVTMTHLLAHVVECWFVFVHLKKHLLTRKKCRAGTALVCSWHPTRTVLSSSNPRQTAKASQ